MRRIVVILAAVVNLAILGGGYWYFFGRAPRALAFDGQVEASTVELAFLTGGRIAEVRVHEGDRVEKGQTVAVLDMTELLEHERNAQTRLRTAESQIPQLETAIEMQRQSYLVEVRRAEAGLAAAQAGSDEVQSGARPQEVEQARQALSAAQSRMENAKRELDRTRGLFESGSAPRKALDNAQTAYELAQTDEKKAREALTLIQEGARPETVKAATARVREAEAVLQQARLQDLAVKKLEQQMVTTRTEVESARAAYQVAQTQRGYGELKAPITGWVTSEDARAGEIVGVGTKVLTLANLSEVSAEINVDERDLGAVSNGQSVIVTTGSLPGRQFEGKIANVAFQSRRDQMQGSHRVQVQIKNEEQVLKPGMKVTVAVP